MNTAPGNVKSPVFGVFLDTQSHTTGNRIVYTHKGCVWSKICQEGRGMKREREYERKRGRERERERERVREKHR